MKPIFSYPVLGQSGELGPKLREGDRQVPEGFYRIEKETVERATPARASKKTARKTR